MFQIQRYCVIEFDQNQCILSIEEKPILPKSNYVVTGIYVFDEHAPEIAKSLTPSLKEKLKLQIC